MTDYYPLLARAVAGLEKSTGEARRALYERARAALVAQLRGADPPLSESEITRERLALEEAVRRVEAEAARQMRDPSPPPGRTAPPPPPPPPPPSSLAPPSSLPPPSSPPQQPPRRDFVDNPPLRRPADTPRPAPPPRGDLDERPRQRPVREPRPAPTPPEGLSAPAGPRDMPAPEPPTRELPTREPPLPKRPAPRAAEARQGPDIPEPDDPLQFNQLERPPAAAEDRAPPRRERPPPRPPEPEEPPPPDAGAPPPGPRRRRPPGPLPRQPIESEPPEGSTAKKGLIAALLTVLIITGLGATAYWQRETISGWFGASRGGAPTAQRDQAQRPKASDRVQQEGQPQSPSSQPQSAPGTPAALVAQRVVLYEEDPNNPEGNRYVGSAIWRTETVSPGPGMSPELAVRADVEIPERRLAMTMSIRRNTDQALPASHTVEIIFNVPADFPFGGVANVPGLLMKEAEQSRGAPLTGLAVKVTTGFFLIGLSATEADLQRNMQLLKERGWFDIPMVYNNGRRAILAIEKGTPGERVFSEAFTAWGR